jgi:hypothetical protein
VDFLTQNAYQNIVVDTVKAFRDISFDKPAHSIPAHLDLLKSGMASTTGTESM